MRADAMALDPPKRIEGATAKPASACSTGVDTSHDTFGELLQVSLWRAAGDGGI
jgi:hypothetical protein